MNTIIQSYVYREDKAWFISTIRRTYSIAAAGGDVTGIETLAWEWNPDTKMTGRLVYQGDSVVDHLALCLCFTRYGKLEEEEGGE